MVMIGKIYNEVQCEGFVFTIWVSEERNRNEFTIHSQAVGKTIYTNKEVWDSDVFKLARLLKQYQYSRIGIKDMINKINKVCRHLEVRETILLDVYTYEAYVSL